jgi:putative spermidine/putrescine transport system permease protein
MVALIESPAGSRPTDAAADPPVRSPRRTLRVWRGVVLGVAAVYFLLPLYAALKFALTKTGGGLSFTAFSSIPSQLGFSAAFELSLRLALVTTVITLVLMVPTAVFVHLRYPNLRRLFDGITILPIVIPPVVLIVGVLEVAPTFLKSTPYLLALEYVVLAMPFAYRSLDAGLQAMDLKTLVEAGRSLGSRSLSILLRVVVPNLRSAILSATVLTVALVLGEYTMATLDQYQTFSVWIVYFDADNAQVSVAASIMALLVTWILLMVIRSLDLRRTRRSFPAKGAS